MRHIEIIARHEFVQSLLLAGSDGILPEDLLLDIIRILTGEERRTIGVNNIIIGGDMEPSDSLTIFVGGYGNFIELWSELMGNWSNRNEWLNRRLEASMRTMRKCVKRVEERRHLELFKSCHPEDEHEHAEYRPADIDAVFMRHV